MKKPISIILCVVMSISICGRIVFANNGNIKNGISTCDISNIKFLASIDTPDPDAITISTAAELNSIRNNLSGSYILTNDIDLSEFNGGEWIPIGDYDNSEYAFRGTFDGQGHVIYNLKITQPSNMMGMSFNGLFGTVCLGGKIKNVGLENINIDIKQDLGFPIHIGSLCAGMSNESEITNCYTTGTISVSTMRNHIVGGIAGIVGGISGAGATINDSFNMCNISTTYGAGGISGTGGFIKNCYNTGDISASVNEAVIGGINVNNTSPYSATVLDCYNTGVLSGPGTIYGIGTGTIRNCYNMGDILSAQEAYGVGNGKISASFNQGAIQNAHDVYGVGDGELNNCYNIGDIRNAYNAYGVGVGNITYCYNSGDISATYSAGGIGLGGNDSFSQFVANCYNMGNISVVGENSVYAGGIFGNATLRSQRMQFDNCYNLGNITASSTNAEAFAGGLGGFLNAGRAQFFENGSTVKIINCYSAGKIYDANYLDGIFGDVNIGEASAVTVDDCYFPNSYGSEYGTPLPLEDMQMPKSFDNFDFESNWALDKSVNNGYPYLWMLPPNAACDEIIPVYTAQQLNCIRSKPSGFYKLQNDIDLSIFDDWEPITDFRGTFDGSNNVIRHLSSTKNGLFSSAPNAIIQNIGIENCNIIVTYPRNGSSNLPRNAYIGGICGTGATVLRNCYTTGEISVFVLAANTISMTAEVGGICGSVNTITNCYNTANITVDDKIQSSRNKVYTYVGGVGGTAKDIINCYNQGEISLIHTGNVVRGAVGGVFGKSTDSIVNSYNIGKVSASTEGTAGGICGEGNNVYLSYNIGEINGRDTVGGICGRASANISSSYNEGNVSSAWIAGGIYALGCGDILDCYNTGDIINNTAKDKACAGGIIGVIIADKCLISNSYNLGEIHSVAEKDVYAGGIIGTNGASANSICETNSGKIFIENSYNSGVVYASSFSSNAYAGGIYSYAYSNKDGQITINNCTNNGNVTSEARTDSHGYAGGICASSSTHNTSEFNHSVIRCKNKGVILGSADSGGICGFSSTNQNIRNILIDDCRNEGEVRGGRCAGGISGTTGTIKRCYNTGNISVESNESACAGGISGSSAIIYNCYNQGSITSKSTYDNSGYYVYSICAGGISGLGGEIQNCYNTGDALAFANACYYWGGICGKLDLLNKGKVTNSYCLNSCKYGTQLTSSQLKQRASYIDWDFNTVWDIDSAVNEGYPYLRSLTAWEPGTVLTPNDSDKGGVVERIEILNSASQNANTVDVKMTLNQSVADLIFIAAIYDENTLSKVYNASTDDESMQSLIILDIPQEYLNQHMKLMLWDKNTLKPYMNVISNF